MTDRILERLSALVGTPSPTGSEEAAVDLVAGWLGDSKADTVDRWTDRMDDLAADAEYPGREVDRVDIPVAAAAARGSRPGPTVVLTGHVDTVGVGEPSHWSRPALQATTEGDLLYGRGACDMKAGVVAALEAFLAFADGDRDFAGEIRFVAVPGEEDGGTGTLAAIRRGWTGDMVLLAEPTAGDIVVAHGGALTFTIEIEGRAAHGATPREGVSALDAFYTVYGAIRDLEQQVNAAEAHPLMRALGVPYPTTVGVINGGEWASNVMAALRAEARVGVTLSETIDAAERRFADGLVAAVADDPWLGGHPPRIQRTGAAFGSSQIDPEDPLVEAVREAAAVTTGRTPRLAAVPYGCDMALWSRVGGARCLVYGPGDVRQAHTADEYVSIRDTVTSTEVLQRAVGALTR